MKLLLPVLAVVVLAFDLWLWSTGRINGPLAVAAVIAAEVTLLGLSLFLSRREARRRGVPLVDLVPPLRLVVWEARAWGDLRRLLRGMEVVPEGAVALPDRRGMWQLPAMFSVAIIIEIVAVELLLPWPWLRIALLILSLYSLPLLWGITAARAVHPHYLDDEELVLRSGRTVVARIPRASVSGVRHDRRFNAERWELADGTLTLGGTEGTNVVLVPGEPVAAARERWPWQSARTSVVTEVRLWLDEPEQLLKQFRADVGGRPTPAAR